MVDQLKYTADSLHRSKIGTLGNGAAGTSGTLPGGQSYDAAMSSLEKTQQIDASPKMLQQDNNVSNPSIGAIADNMD